MQLQPRAEMTSSFTPLVSSQSHQDWAARVRSSHYSSHLLQGAAVFVVTCHFIVATEMVIILDGCHERGMSIIHLLIPAYNTHTYI